MNVFGKLLKRERQKNTEQDKKQNNNNNVDNDSLGLLWGIATIVLRVLLTKVGIPGGGVAVGETRHGE